MKLSYVDVLTTYYPGTQWALSGNGLEWFESTIPKPTDEELDAKLQELIAAQPMKLLRKERDSRLAACDWITLKSYSTDERVPEVWRVYMQALRDLPSTATPTLNEDGTLNIESVDWPVKP